MKEYLENRIKYLRKLEADELTKLDSTKRGTIERESCWTLIREVSNRRNELECALNAFTAQQAKPNSDTSINDNLEIDLGSLEHQFEKVRNKIVGEEFTFVQNVIANKDEKLYKKAWEIVNK